VIPYGELPAPVIEFPEKRAEQFYIRIPEDEIPYVPSYHKQFVGETIQKEKK